jgi:hypothetical protein
MYSRGSSASRKSGDQILGVISRQRAESFLVECVNLPHVWPDKFEVRSEQMLAAYPDIFKDFMSPEKPLAVQFNTRLPAKRESLRDLLHELTHTLRMVWNAHDIRSRDWFITMARLAAHERLHASEPNPEKRHYLTWDKPPDETPFEAVMFYLQRKSDYVARCDNPTCAAPYFLAAKRSQRYCSERCATEGLRAAKLRWWNENRKSGGIE